MSGLINIETRLKWRYGPAMLRIIVYSSGYETGTDSDHELSGRTKLCSVRLICTSQVAPYCGETSRNWWKVGCRVKIILMYDLI